MLGGTGTVNDPYLISTVADFISIKTNPTANYKLMNDIDFAGTTYSYRLMDSAWFSGVLDGDGYGLYNITMSASSGTLSIFYVVTGTIKNLSINNANINATSSNHAATLAAELQGAIIEKVHVNNCTIQSYSGNVAGMTWTANESADGRRGSSFTDCSVTNTSIKVSSGTGLACGLTYGGQTLTTLNRIFIGLNIQMQSGGANWRYAVSNIAFATVSGVCVDRTNQHANTDYRNVSVFTDLNSFKAATYTTFDFTNVWKINEDKSYPQLRVLKKLDGAGTELDPYLIKTIPEFLKMGMDTLSRFKLNNDLDFTGITYTKKPLGELTFAGVFDGDGYSLKNMTVDTGSTNINSAIFNRISGQVKNLKIENYNGSSYMSYIHTAVLAYSLEAGTVSKVTVTNSTVFSGGGYSSGLVTYLNPINGIGSSVSDTSITYTSIVSSGGKASGLANYNGNIYTKLTGIIIGLYHPLSATNRELICPNGGTWNAIHLDNTNNTNTTYPSNWSPMTEATRFKKSTYWELNFTDVWEIKEDVSYPTLKIMSKIVTKIEQRLIASYSKVVHAKQNRFISKLKDVLSFAKKNQSDVGKSAAKSKIVTSFKKKANSTLTKLKKKKVFNTSHSKKPQSFIIKSGSKLRKLVTHGLPISSSLLKKRIKRVLMKTYSKKVVSNTREVKKKLSSIMSFAKKNDTAALRFKRRIQQVMSYSDSFFSKASRTVRSFKYRLVQKTSHMTTSSSKVVRMGKSKKILTNWTKAFVSAVTRLTLNRNPRKAKAKVSYKLFQTNTMYHTSNTKTDTKEHGTKTTYKDGGDD